MSFINNTARQNWNYICVQLGLYFQIISDILKTKFKNSVYVYKKSGIFYEPLSPPETPMEANIKEEIPIKILSYNVDDFVCHHHRYGKDNQVRATEIINYLESTEADIICLQEVWGEIMKQEFTDAFLAKNFYVALPNWRKNYIFGENSGLMMLSRYPIVTQTFLPFNNSSISLANKGVQYCHIRVPNSNPKTSITLNIANTHLHSSYKKDMKYLNLQLDFSNTAKQQLQTIVSECPYESCILTGTFNLGDSAMDDFINNESKISYFGENRETTYPVDDERVDYMLKITKLVNFSSNSIELRQNTTASEVSLSDHYPIISEFVLKTVQEVNV